MIKDLSDDNKVRSMVMEYNKPADQPKQNKQPQTGIQHQDEGHRPEGPVNS